MSSNSKQSSTTNFPVPRNGNTPKSNNPFGSKSSTSSSSRFGSSSSSSASSRFGSSRFSSRQEVLWTVKPSAKRAVRISLQGLGDPIFRLLGHPINPELSDTSKLIEVLSQNKELHDEVVAVLDEAWETYNLRGATLVYPWNENIVKAFTNPIEPTPPPPQKEKAEGDKNKDEDTYDDFLDDDDIDLTPKAKQTWTQRAIDTAFVLNILGRTRANVLVGNTPLALEEGFLNRVIICDDKRILELAQATGCIEEEW